MADTHVILPRTRIVRLGEQYNADSALASFGTTPAGNVLGSSDPETFLVYALWPSTAATAYVASQCDSAANNGWRINRITAGTQVPSLNYRNASGQDTRGAWAATDVAAKVAHVAFVLDGTLGDSGSNVYSSLGTNAPLTSDKSAASGLTGSATATTGTLTVGNRISSASRHFSDGVIYYIARWNRILLLAELRKAQMKGPLAVPKGLILCWSNGVDYGPYGLRPSTYTPTSKVVSPRRSLLSN